MSIGDRPYIGTYALNNRGLVRHVPDCLVYINGSLDISGCSGCGGRIDLQQFISATSVDAGVETGGASASVTLHIPRSEGASFFRDGQFILKPGLEINIYYRGYFPVSGILADKPPSETGGVDVSNSVMYPYYHVFHGVVTNTSYEYSGGEHTASLTCADMLHFWNYQVMSTSGSLFGARPSNSGLKFTLTGNSFREMTPYSIVYTLYREVMGAAGGVEFTMSQTTNQAAKGGSGDDLWSLAILYWEQRFSSNFNSLRMYGTDGSLYNAFQQAFVGQLSSEQVRNLAKEFAEPSNKEKAWTAFDGDAKVARLLGYDVAGTYMSGKSEKDAKKGGAGINVAQMQAYITDISTFGQVNLWESTYETKMNVVQQVSQVTGFEFFQDVDGDFVFKPPFYNLDTSSNRVFVIKDIDLISITFTEAEPEVTALSVKSSYYSNMTGIGVEGTPFGVGASYIDYRLVAQFGFRQNTFEAAYLTDSKALFYACVSRMDLFNLNMHTASCQIPLRPELRPGFPVYLEPFDCFYYLKSFSHTFSFGGQCTTNLTLAGRRAKFYAPGVAPLDGAKPTVDNIFLSDPWLPPTPLETQGNDQVPRLQGFPNVVLAIDNELLNPNYFSVGLSLTELSTEAGMQALIRKAKDLGVLQVDEEAAGEKGRRGQWLEGPFLLQSGRSAAIKIPSATDLLAQAASYQTSYQANRPKLDPKTEDGGYNTTILDTELAKETASDVQAIIDAIQAMSKTGIEDGDQTANYLTMLNDTKASFNPGAATPGYYRYYSSSHPDPEQQGMKEMVADASTSGTTQAGDLIHLDSPKTVIGFQKNSTTLGKITVTAGIPLMRPNTGAGDARAVATPTHMIGTLAFAQSRTTEEISVPLVSSSRINSYPKKKYEEVVIPRLRAVADYSSGEAVQSRFAGLYATLALLVTEVPKTLDLTNLEKTEVPIFPAALASLPCQTTDYRGQKVGDNLDKLVEELFKSESEGVKTIAKTLAKALSDPVQAIFKNAFEERKAEVGAPKQVKGATTEQVQANTDAYAELDIAWGNLIIDSSSDDQAVSVQGDKAAPLKIQIPKFSDESKQYTPVFPVSDERGYEVIGSYRYGRGLSTAQGGSFQQLHDVDFYALGNVDAIDMFIQEIQNQDSLAIALGVVAESFPEEAAALAAASGVQATGGNDILAAVSADPTQFETGFANFMSSTNDASQKVTTTNAAYSLADLGLQTSRQVCSCKSAEADVLLMAYGEQGFVATDQPDVVSQWMADQNLAISKAWEASQEALRGQVLDGSTRNLSDAFKAAKGQLVSGMSSAVGDFEQAKGDLQAAGAAVKSDAESIPDSVLSYPDEAVSFFNPNPDED